MAFRPVSDVAGERVLGDPACAAPHPADDRGAAYVRPDAALLAAVGTVLAARRARHQGRESRGRFQSGTSRNGGGRRLRGVSQEGRRTHCTDEETSMSTEENKAIVGRWFTEFWGKEFNPAVIDELAAPDVRFEYSLHEPLRGRDAVRAFAQKFRAAFPDLNFWGTADLIAEGDYVVGQWEGGGTQTGDAFD